MQFNKHRSRELDSKLLQLKAVALGPSSGLSEAERKKSIQIIDHALGAKDALVKERAIKSEGARMFGNDVSKVAPLCDGIAKAGPAISSEEIWDSVNSGKFGGPERRSALEGLDIGSINFDDTAYGKDMRLKLSPKADYSEKDYGDDKGYDKKSDYSDLRLISIGGKLYVYSYVDPGMKAPKAIGKDVREFGSAEKAGQAAKGGLLSGEIMERGRNGGLRDVRFVVYKPLEGKEALAFEYFLREKLAG